MLTHFGFLNANSARHTHRTLPGAVRTSSQLLTYLLPLSLSLLVVHLLLACAHARSSPQHPRLQYGKASWYGETFHGRQTASGEIYDMSQLTAAHKHVPLGTDAIVTRLDTGHAVRVRINDRGPFVKGRIIDLSHAAARQLNMLKVGVARVKVEFLLGKTSPSTFIVQAGAYRRQSNAARVQRILAEHYPSVQIMKAELGSKPLYRVRLGPFDTQVKAKQVARQVQALGYASAVLPLP